MQVMKNRLTSIETVGEGRDKRIRFVIDGEEMTATRFDLLALACKCSSEMGEDLGEILFNLASSTFHPENDVTFNTLYGAARIDAARSERHRRRRREKGK